MKKLLAAIGCYLFLACPALCQSSPNWGFGYVPTPAQWSAAFAAKADYLGAAYCPVTGCTISGQLITAPSSTLFAGLNIAPGVAPTSPNNGDVWTTTVGLYVRINGVTIGPLSSTASTVQQIIDLNTSPLQAPQTGTILQMGNANGVISRTELDSYAAVSAWSCLRADGTAAVPTTLQLNDEICSMNGGGYNGAAFLLGSARISIFAAQNWSVGANGSYIRLSTTPNGMAAGAPIDRFSIENDGGLMTFNAGVAPTGGSEGNGSLNLFGPLYNNGTAPTGTGAYVRATSPALVTPSLGVGTATSLALGGASIGSNALAVTGTTNLGGALTYGGVTFANTTTGSGSLVGGTSPTLATPVLNGTPTGTGVATNPTANTLALRDASGNLFTNNIYYGTTPTASAGGTTVLTVGSTLVQQLTGSANQTYQLPNATTLILDSTYEFDDNSTGTLSVIDASSNPIATVLAGAYARVTNINNGSSAGVWDYHYLLPKNVLWGNSAATVPSYIADTGTTGPASAAGQTVVTGTLASAPTLGVAGQAWLYNTAVNGAVHQGQGSTYDAVIEDNAGAVAAGVSTGTQNMVFLGNITASALTTSGTISGSICQDASGHIIDKAGVNCFTAGAATSLAPGTTTISPSNPGYALTNSAGIVQNNQLYSTAGGWVNKFRNSGQQVWDLGISALATATATAGAYVNAGWRVQQTGTAFTCAQDSTTHSGTYTTFFTLKCVGGTSNTDTVFKHRIESQDAAPLEGQTVTVTFQMEQNTGSSITPKISTCFASATDNFGTCTGDLASTSLSACATATFCTQSYTFTASASAVNGYEVDLDCNTALTAAQSCWLGAADIRVTPGVTTGINSNPPLPELRPVAIEVANDARYYQAQSQPFLYGRVNVGATACVNMSQPFLAPMRASPTVTMTSAIGLEDGLGNVTNASSLSSPVFNSNFSAVQYTFAVTGLTASSICYSNFGGTGTITLDARL